MSNGVIEPQNVVLDLTGGEGAWAPGDPLEPPLWLHKVIFYSVLISMPLLLGSLPNLARNWKIEHIDCVINSIN